MSPSGADRQAFAAVAPGSTPWVGARLEGGPLLVLPSDDERAMGVFARRASERVELLRSALPLIGPANVLVDAGAAYGEAALSALLEHGFESAVAVEADPGRFRLMCVNVVANGLAGRVQTVNGRFAPDMARDPHCVVVFGEPEDANEALATGRFPPPQIRVLVGGDRGATAEVRAAAHSQEREVADVGASGLLMRPGPAEAAGGS